MLLNPADSKKLMPILSAVNDKLLVEVIIEVSQGIIGKVVDKKFPLIYAGILLASSERIDDSIAILSLCSHPFCIALREYLQESKEFIPASKAFQETTPYDVWIKGNFYQSYLTNTLNILKKFIIENPPPFDSIPTIIDIGTGNGVLIVEIIKQILAVISLKEIKVILIDQSPEMLKAATKYCQESIPISITLIPLCASIEEIAKTSVNFWDDKDKLWFINAAASLHHLPREIKLPTFKYLHNLSVPCLITECQGNHDQPEKNSPELIYSVVEFYGFFVQDINNCDVSDQDKKNCLDNLVLTEAITILKNDRTQRKDYHALISEWEDVSKESGFNITHITPTLLLANIPFLFTMELQPNF